MTSETDYNDIYDRQTIKECVRVEHALEETLAKVSEYDPEREKAVSSYHIVRNIAMIAIKGSNAERKEKYLREWAEKDKRRADLLESAKPRTDINCFTCDSFLNFDFKTYYSAMDEQERVLLFYSCPNNCLPNRAFFNNGEEYISKPTLCKKCDGETDSDVNREGITTTITWTCKLCGTKEIDKHDFSHKEKKEDPIDEILRKEYCLDEKGLESYRQMKRDMKTFEDMMKRTKAQQEDTKTNERMESLKRLRVMGLQERITKPLEKLGMTKVDLSQPTNERGLKVTITILDSMQDRADKESKKIVEKALIRSLRTTNWRLVKSSLESTLGAITGQLIGYTSDEQLRKVIEIENIPNIKRT
ncbi:MAG: hypothetical protein HQ488_02850 [Parcubacteria group bacterium]|nr:hypothetical protein [Parcubacteria group bacterium]